MRIDAHQHFWRYDPARDGWITDEMSAIRRDFLFEDLRPELCAARIDAIVAVQADQSETETHFLLDLARANSEIAGVVGWVDLRAENAPARLEYFSNFKVIRGFRHIAQAEPDDCFLVRDDFVRGVAQLAGLDLTYDILIYPRQLPAAVELVRRLPRQRFVLDHIAKPNVKAGEIEPWASLIRQMSECENVYCKVSGLVTEADWKNWKPSDFAPYLDVVFEAFGTDRLMFGSDWPVCLVAASYRETVDLIANYCGSDREKIFGANAARFYGLTA